MGKVRVFIDASVLFAACYSSTGAAREIIRYAIRGDMELVASQLVLTEVERNLTNKSPQALAVLQIVLQTTPLELSSPTPAEILQMKPHTALKDAPVLAAALKAGVDYLVSHDQKHMLDLRVEIDRETGLKILSPVELLPVIRSQLSNN